MQEVDRTDPLAVEEDNDLWTRYAEGTAGRQPQEFFDRALEVTDGEQGSGRLVVDLGSGAGNETLGFLERGWAVHAVDGNSGAMEVLLSRVPDDLNGRLTHEIALFNEAILPEADLVFASFSLPFAASNLDESVAAAAAAVKPGGWFLGVFFGHNDTWASEEDVATVDTEGIKRFFDGFELEIEEQEFDGSSSGGDKHWHLYVVVARRQA